MHSPNPRRFSAVSSQQSYSHQHQSSFTIHGVCLIFMMIMVGYEIPLVYDQLSALFDTVYTTLFPAGVVIALLEGLRVGMSGQHCTRAGSVDIGPIPLEPYSFAASIAENVSVTPPGSPRRSPCLTPMREPVGLRLSMDSSSGSEERDRMERMRSSPDPEVCGGNMSPERTGVYGRDGGSSLRGGEGEWGRWVENNARRSEHNARACFERLKSVTNIHSVLQSGEPSDLS